MKKIFIIDDNLFMRQHLKKIIEANEEYEVIGLAENGRIALEKLEKLSVDLVTLDLTMPEMDGLEFLKKLKDLNYSFKIILISAALHKENIVEAINLGANEFILKPYEKEELYEKFKIVLN